MSFYWALRTFMRRTLIAFAFLATFMVEVRVKADTLQLPNAKNLEAEPADCWKNQGPCAVRTASGERAELTWAGRLLIASESSLIVRESDSRLRVLHGTVWLRSKTPVTIESEFGQISSEAGEFWVTRTADRLTAAAIDGALWLSPRGTDEKLEVSPGLENWLGHVLPTVGRAQSGVPIAIDLKSHLQRWAKLYDGKLPEFEKEAAVFYERWSAATQAAADIHKALFNRKMASLDAVEAERAALRRKEQTRTDELVRIFRERTLGP